MIISFTIVLCFRGKRYFLKRPFIARKQNSSKYANRNIHLLILIQFNRSPSVSIEMTYLDCSSRPPEQINHPIRKKIKNVVEKRGHNFTRVSLQTHTYTYKNFGTHVCLTNPRRDPSSRRRIATKSRRIPRGSRSRFTTAQRIFHSSSGNIECSEQVKTSRRHTWI